MGYSPNKNASDRNDGHFSSEQSADQELARRGSGRSFALSVHDALAHIGRTALRHDDAFNAAVANIRKHIG